MTERLAQLVARRDVADLVAELEVLASSPGDVPPAVRRLRAAAVELLDEVGSVPVRRAVEGPPQSDHGG